MNKAEKKFRYSAILVIFVLLTVLLAVINGMNFTMAASDADEITQMLADRQGAFERQDNAPKGMPFREKESGFRMGPMGPDSPELDASLRYFTIAFSEDGNTQTVAYHVSAVSEDEAREWAAGLIGETTGWTKFTYRYRVYEKGGVTYVTVIDQGRELLPAFRILLISAIGELIALIVAWLTLQFIARKVYAPLEEADRKQRQFLVQANREFGVPLTVLSANTLLMERRHGPDDETRSNRRQLKKMNELVSRLGTLGVWEEAPSDRADVPISEYLDAALDREAEAFDSRAIALTRDVSPGVVLSADPDAICRLVDELLNNAEKFAKTFAHFTLREENGFVVLETQNDADLPDGPVNQVFDRFTTLHPAENETAGAGLGLSNVKEIVKAHHGRASASVTGGVFRLRITL